MIFIPFAMQAFVIFLDEFIFHVKRGLPLWERIGHPLDTLSFLICLAFPLFVPYSFQSLWYYGGFALFSCCMVTKDEFIHKHHCPWKENWLHACLFLLHPIVLTATALIWMHLHHENLPAWIIMWMPLESTLLLGLQMQGAAIFIFFLYQIIFWNLIWKNKPVLKM